MAPSRRRKAQTAPPPTDVAVTPTPKPRARPRPRSPSLIIGSVEPSPRRPRLRVPTEKATTMAAALATPRGPRARTAPTVRSKDPTPPPVITRPIKTRIVNKPWGPTEGPIPPPSILQRLHEYRVQQQGETRIPSPASSNEDLISRDQDGIADDPEIAFEEQRNEISEMPCIYNCMIKIYVNKHPFLADSLGQLRGHELDTDIIEQRLQTAIDEAGIEEIKTRVVYIRARHTRSTKVTVTLTDFSESQWDRVEDVLEDEWVKYLRELDIKIEIHTVSSTFSIQRNTGNKRRRSASAPPTPEKPMARRTRTDALLERQANRSERLEDMGNFVKKICDRWHCANDNCRNRNNFCFVDYGGKHYDISVQQQERWSNSIAQGSASVEAPPQALYLWWTRSQGEVSDDYKRPILTAKRQEQKNATTDLMQSMIEMQKHALEMRMMESITESTERSSSRRPHFEAASVQPPPYYHQPAQIPYAVHPSYPYPFPPSQPQYPTTTAAATAAAEPSSRPQAAAPTSRPASAHGHQTATLRSSPIEEGNDDEVLASYFADRLQQALSSGANYKYEKLMKAFQLVRDEMWDVDDVKDMSNTKSRVYEIAMENNIPDGMARSFHADLKRYKAQWRGARGLQRLGTEFE